MLAYSRVDFPTTPLRASAAWKKPAQSGTWLSPMVPGDLHISNPVHPIHQQPNRYMVCRGTCHSSCHSLGYVDILFPACFAPRGEPASQSTQQLRTLNKTQQPTLSSAGPSSKRHEATPVKPPSSSHIFLRSKCQASYNPTDALHIDANPLNSPSPGITVPGVSPGARATQTTSSPRHGVRFDSTRSDLTSSPLTHHATLASLTQVVPDAPPAHPLTTEEMWYAVLKGKHPGIYLGL